MNKNKKLFLLLAFFIAVGLFGGFNLATSDSLTGNQIALAASASLDVSDLEYIKINHPKGYSEHWRDLKNLQERSDSYDTEGNLSNRIIVKENGKRVITMGYKDGKPEGYTWVLPSNVADYNKTNLTKSLLKDVKDELSKSKWENKGLVKLPNGKNAHKIESSFDDTLEVVYVDEATNFPVKREFYEKKNNQLQLIEARTEEYKNVRGNSEEIFTHDGINLKEIPAPVVGDPNNAAG